MSAVTTAATLPRGDAGFRLALLWLAGAGLRVTLLAVPPVLPLIHGDLALSETSVAVLTGMPVLLLGLAAIPGSLLIARFGARRTLVAGLAVIAASSALRGVGPAAAILFGTTFLMGAAISVIQPALPSMVSRWFPSSTVLATAVYANGLLVGELLSASLTLPLVLPAVGGSWALSFVVWAVPVAATAVLIGGFTPQERPEPGGKPALWWPDWRSAQMWQLGLMQGGNGAIFFGANSFLPDYLHAIGRGDLVGTCLTALNAGPILASVIALVLASRLATRKTAMMATGALALLGLAGVFTGISAIMAMGAALVGFATGLALILLIALPPLLAHPGDVHRLSAGMFMIGFTASFALPLLGGGVWDATGYPAAAFLPVVVGGLMISLIAAKTSFQPEAARR